METNNEFNPAYPLDKGFNAIPVQDVQPVNPEKKKSALDCLQAMIEKSRRDLMERK